MRNNRNSNCALRTPHALLDDGSYRELLDPFDGIMSPWLGAVSSAVRRRYGGHKGTINGSLRW